MKIKRCDLKKKEPKKPKPRIYTGKDLHTDAPEGVYRHCSINGNWRTGLANDAYVVLTGVSDSRCVLRLDERVFQASGARTCRAFKFILDKTTTLGVGLVKIDE